MVMLLNIKGYVIEYQRFIEYYGYVRISKFMSEYQWLCY